MKTILTKKCYEELKEKLYNLTYKDQAEASEQVAECRPIGCFEDNPEYLQSMENLAQINRKIIELNNLLSNCIILTKDISDRNKNIVAFGATVTFKNIETDKETTYTILSIYDSNINDGTISIEAPLVKQMIGLQVGDCFEFKDIDYEITNISYSSQLY